MRISILALLALSLMCGPAIALDDYPRHWDVDIVHYLFHLTLSDTSDEIEHSFTFSVEGAPRELTLDPDTWLLFEGELAQR